MSSHFFMPQPVLLYSPSGEYTKIEQAFKTKKTQQGVLRASLLLEGYIYLY